jgi:hypothetical protein
VDLSVEAAGLSRALSAAINKASVKALSKNVAGEAATEVYFVILYPTYPTNLPNLSYLIL